MGMTSTKRTGENPYFQSFLKHYGLQALDVSVVARVRYLVVWRILHGLPVSEGRAAQVREGVYKMTGTRYTGPIVTEPFGVVGAEGSEGR